MEYGDLADGRERKGCTPFFGPISFIFMQFSGKNGQKWPHVNSGSAIVKSIFFQ